MCLCLQAHFSEWKSHSCFLECFIIHSIHGTGIFTHMETIKNQLKHVGKHTVLPMDSMMGVFSLDFPGRKRSDSTRRRCRTTKTWGKPKKVEFWIFDGTQGPRTGWWFQIFLKVHPCLGKIPIWTNIFQMGWNHQLEDRLFLNEDVWNQQLRSKKDSFQHLNLHSESLFTSKNDNGSNWTLATFSPIIMVPLRISDWTHPKKEWVWICISQGSGLYLQSPLVTTEIPADS